MFFLKTFFSSLSGGLGTSHKAFGSLQQALVCFEKRLYVAHETQALTAKASAYGELGYLYSLLGKCVLFIILTISRVHT